MLVDEFQLFGFTGLAAYYNR